MQVAVGLVGGGGSTDYTCFMTMHAGLCGPGGRWWQHTAGFYDYACRSLWAWWEVVAAHRRVHDYACRSLYAWWEVVEAHRRVL